MNTEPDIGRDYAALLSARQKKAAELMEAYDRDVHRPAVQALRQRCAEAGHKAAERWHDNGLGWLTRYCGACGARVESVGPDAP